MSDEQKSETEPEEQKRRRLRRRKKEAVETSPASEAKETPPASEATPKKSGSAPKAERPRVASSADDAPEQVEAAVPVEPAAAATPPPPKPPAPAPARRRQRERPPGPPPVVRAQAKYVRSSPRKARLVCDHIRGRSVEDARAVLAHTPRAIARDWSKLLESAVANAEHNHELVGEDLFVKAVHADDGPTLKRFRPRAKGRATRIRKRTSHLTILLTAKE
jgi:ribosomal protein L22